MCWILGSTLNAPLNSTSHESIVSIQEDLSDSLSETVPESATNPEGCVNEPTDTTIYEIGTGCEQVTGELFITVKCLSSSQVH